MQKHREWSRAENQWRCITLAPRGTEITTTMMIAATIKDMFLLQIVNRNTYLGFLPLPSIYILCPGTCSPLPPWGQSITYPLMLGMTLWFALSNSTRLTVTTSQLWAYALRSLTSLSLFLNLSHLVGGTWPLAFWSWGRDGREEDERPVEWTWLHWCSLRQSCPGKLTKSWAK